MQEYFKKIVIRIAAVGIVGVFIANNTIPHVYNLKIQKSDHYKQAVELLHKHPEAIKYLGEPIKEKRVNVTKPANFGEDGEKMWIRFPVIGKLTHGILYYDFSIPKDENEKSKLLNVELTVDTLKDYKLLIKRPD